MPGIGDKLSAIFGGGGATTPGTPQQQISALANAGFPGAQQMQANPSPATPPGAPPSNAYQVAYLQLVNQGVDPTEAAILAQEQVAQQGPSPWATATAGLSDVGNEILAAKLRPELGELPSSRLANVSAPGALPFQGAPSPNSAITTASIIAELV